MVIDWTLNQRGRPFRQGDRVELRESPDGDPRIGTVTTNEEEGWVTVRWDTDDVWPLRIAAMRLIPDRSPRPDTLLGAAFTLDDTLIECPVCADGFAYVHPTRVEVNAGGEITTVDSDGTRLRTGRAAGRGVLITLAFFCENGHPFEQRIEFYKGATLTSIHRRTADAEHEHTIWRD